MAKYVSNKAFEKCLGKTNWQKIVQQAENTVKGNRIYNDSSLSVRYDRGSDVDGKPEVVMQANKNASEPSVKKAAQKNSHDVIAKGRVDKEGDPDGKELQKQLRADFMERNK